MKAKKLPSGNWRVNAYVGRDAENKQVRKSFTAPTRKEAELLALEFLNSNKEVIHTSDMTVREAFDELLKKKKLYVSPSTFAEYKRISERDFQSLMNYKVAKISTKMVQAEIDKMTVKGNSNRTIKNAVSILNQACKLANKRFELDELTYPKAVKFVDKIPTKEEVKLLFDNCDYIPMKKAILLAACGTLRRSEVCGLSLSDFRDGGILVQSAVVKDSNKDHIEKVTKTKESTRFVALPNSILEFLKDGATDKIVPLTPDAVTRRFEKLTMAVLGHTIRFHSLRHYSATQMHNLNIPTKYAMERGGWSEEKTMMNIYTHTMDKERAKFNDLIFSDFEEIYNKSPKPKRKFKLAKKSYCEH